MFDAFIKCVRSGINIDQRIRQNFLFTEFTVLHWSLIMKLLRGVCFLSPRNEFISLATPKPD